MPIVPKKKVTEACASYALDTMICVLGLSDCTLEKLRWHDIEPDKVISVVGHLIRPNAQKLGIALIMIRRNKNPENDQRWYPCIIRVKASRTLVKYYRLFFDPEDNLSYTLPKIVGFKQLFGWQHSRVALLNANLSRNTRTKIRKLPLIIRPPST